MIQNVGQLIDVAAEDWPDHAAVAQPCGNDWRSVPFAELNSDCNAIAAGLASSGLKPGTRIGLLVPPGIDFVAVVFALFKTGAVVILIDPGIGRDNLIQCLSDARPQGIVSIAKGQIARWIYRKRLPEAKLNFVVGRPWWPGCKSIDTFRKSATSDFQVPLADRNAQAAIIFTSGSTGVPKGVAYEHGNFIVQAEEIRDYFQIAPGGADISGFPLFALFNTAMGKTTVFPKMDYTRPADVNPQIFVDAAEHWQADQSFGSPALWNTVARWCEDNHKRLPRIQRVLSAGAPVPAHVLSRVKKIIAHEGDVYTPYGATEALPVACNSATIVLSETAAKTARGAGVCVGGRFRQIAWKVIAISDQPIANIDQASEMPAGQIGELIVSGPVVTRQYVTSTDANAFHKISDGSRFWHRMGDVGYLDEYQRFWFCGRKSQRVICQAGTLFTVPCESIVNTHPAIYRSGLAGIGHWPKQRPVIVAEPWPEQWPATPDRKKRLERELYELCQRNELTVQVESVFLKKKLPVDIRHNSKIFREQLADWAATRLDAN